MTTNAIRRLCAVVLILGVGMAAGGCKDRSEGTGSGMEGAGVPMLAEASDIAAAASILPPDAVPAQLERLHLPEDASIAALGPRYVTLLRNEGSARLLWERMAGAGAQPPVLDWTSDAVLVLGLPVGVDLPHVFRADSSLYVFLRLDDPAALRPHAFRVIDAPKDARFRVWRSSSPESR